MPERREFLSPVCTFLPRWHLVRLSSACRQLQKLAEQLNPWVHVVDPHIPWSQFEPGTRIAVHGKLSGIQNVSCTGVLIDGGRPGCGRLSVVVVHPGCRVAMRQLRMRKLVGESQSACHLLGCQVINPYGEGVVLTNAWGSLHRSFLFCRDLALQLNHSAVAIGHTEIRGGHGVLSNLSRLQMWDSQLRQCGLCVQGGQAELFRNHISSGASSSAGGGRWGRSTLEHGHHHSEAGGALVLSNCGGLLQDNCVQGVASLSGLCPVLRNNQLHATQVGLYGTPIMYQNVLGHLSIHPSAHPVIVNNDVGTAPAIRRGIEMNNVLVC